METEYDDVKVKYIKIFIKASLERLKYQKTQVEKLREELEIKDTIIEQLKSQNKILSEKYLKDSEYHSECLVMKNEVNI